MYASRERCLFDSARMTRSREAVTISRKPFGPYWGWRCPKCGYFAISGTTLRKIYSRARSKRVSLDAVEDWMDGVVPKDKIRLGRGATTAPIGGPRAHIRPSWFEDLERLARKLPYVWTYRLDLKTRQPWFEFSRNNRYAGPRIKDLDSWRIAHHIPRGKWMFKPGERPTRGRNSAPGRSPTNRVDPTDPVFKAFPLAQQDGD
jgi:hypothetical protein